MIRLLILGLILGISTFFYLAFENTAAASPLAAAGSAGEASSNVTTKNSVGHVGEVDTYLTKEFCTDNLCPEGDWQTWIIAEEQNVWAINELEMVRTVLMHTMTALSEAGLDQQKLLRGYRFRRYAGEYVDGIDGKIAVVRHQSQEIVLSDVAFLRLGGFYIYHELGHVVNQRLGQKMVQGFQLRACSPESHTTADGYWLNYHAKHDWGESTADAFALWAGVTVGGLKQPVFAGTPPDTDYSAIIETMQLTMSHLASENG